MGHSLEAWLQLIVGRSRAQTEREVTGVPNRRHRKQAVTTVSIASDLPTLKNPRPEERLGLDILCQGSA